MTPLEREVKAIFKKFDKNRSRQYNITHRENNQYDVRNTYMENLKKKENGRVSFVKLNNVQKVVQVLQESLPILQKQLLVHHTVLEVGLDLHVKHMPVESLEILHLFPLLLQPIRLQKLSMPSLP